jgi:hypothetical protein
MANDNEPIGLENVRDNPSKPSPAPDEFDHGSQTKQKNAAIYRPTTQTSKRNQANKYLRHRQPTLCRHVVISMEGLMRFDVAFVIAMISPK